MRFENRRQAGRELALRLDEWAKSRDLADVTVVALPRGGVPVGAEIARVLKMPLDILVVRKIGVPGAPEVGIGAIVGDDPPLYDRAGLAALHLSEEGLDSEVTRERAELHRREQVYRAGRPPYGIRGRSVMLVDDGLATGITARAALRHLRSREPHRLTLAVPVCIPDMAAALGKEADDVVSLHQPQSLRSVGEWYADFRQVSDEEVLDALREPDQA
ncbi:phosphoribosyltransferase [Streptomyces sp. N2-109]|uniref:Phosphoribosyltransferase n=1 Tax=Streptomyces gossypii TaxID=2883101 RepID=A0ABT2K1I6_9ACTN|nr:phosphoribosyltransferase family protein [Streptomyces gossypii]MCT2594020.1 phosphoribosyltransferase [Streptomyces gossypii]